MQAASYKTLKTAEDENAKEVAKDGIKGSLTPAYRAAKDAYETLKG